MEGDSFITANPFTFHDDRSWSYADLRQLCKRFNIGANGSREELVAKLIEWHRKRDAYGNSTVVNDPDNEENIPMNVHGNNFAVLNLNVVPQSAEKRSRSKQRILKSADVIKACPMSLKPLQLASLTVGTPSKSILKRTESPTSVDRAEMDSQCSTSSDSTGAAGSRAGISSTTTTPGKLDKITFSPFNAVKVIPHRNTARVLTLTLGNNSSSDDDEESEEEGVFSTEEEGIDEEEEEAPANTSRRIAFAVDVERPPDGEEFTEDDEYEYEEEEEEDDEDVYSDDETSFLVFSNTQRNSSIQNYLTEEELKAGVLSAAVASISALAGAGDADDDSEPMDEDEDCTYPQRAAANGLTSAALPINFGGLNNTNCNVGSNYKMMSSDRTFFGTNCNNNSTVTMVNRSAAWGQQTAGTQQFSLCHPSLPQLHQNNVDDFSAHTFFEF